MYSVTDQHGHSIDYDSVYDAVDALAPIYYRAFGDELDDVSAVLMLNDMPHGSTLDLDLIKVERA